MEKQEKKLVLTVTEHAGSKKSSYSFESGTRWCRRDFTLIRMFLRQVHKVIQHGYTDVEVKRNEMSCTLHGVKFNYKLEKVAV